MFQRGRANLCLDIDLYTCFGAILVFLFRTTQNIGPSNKFESKFENYVSQRITRISEIEFLCHNGPTALVNSSSVLPPSPRATARNYKACKFEIKDQTWGLAGGGGGTGGSWNLQCINRNHYIPPFPGVHRQAFVHFPCFGEAVCVLFSFSQRRGYKGIQLLP